MAETKVTTCRRCGRPALGSSDGSPNALVYKRAMKGECTECHAVVILKGLNEMHGGMLFKDGPECLRLPHIQEQFAAVMKAGMADASPDEINWEGVIALWDAVADKPKGLF